MTEAPEPFAVAMDPIQTLALTSSFLYHASELNRTGDPDQDLTNEQTLAFMHMAEHFLIYIGLFPEDWQFVAAPEEGKADKVMEWTRQMRKSSDS